MIDVLYVLDFLLFPLFGFPVVGLFAGASTWSTFP